MQHYLAIDLGGTKTSVCLGEADGRLHHGRRMPTEADADPALWLDRLRGLVGTVLSDAGLAMKDLAAVGVATPGPMSVRSGLVLAPPNMPAWREVPIRSWIEDLTGRPVFINNDANAAGLAEYFFGEFRGTPDLVYLTMSTGIGAGVMSGGQLVQGADDLGGEVGHFVLDPDGPPCPCGQRGCFEMYCGGRNVIEQVKRRMETESAPLILRESGGEPGGITISAIARAALGGDRLAGEFWERFLDRLAQGVGIVTMCFNPSAIVMGTIAIHLGETLLEPLRARLPRYCWPQARRNLAIRKSALGPGIGDLGALAIALQNTRQLA